MTEHLPECPMSTKDTICRCLPCICDALRACEERVFALHPEWTVTGMCKPECAACRRLTELITEWEYGYEKGIDDAREAVASVEYRPTHLETIIRSIALNAIDALREKP